MGRNPGPIASDGDNVRGGTSGRADPAPASLDGFGNKTDVAGKDPNFDYRWLNPRSLKNLLNPRFVQEGANEGKIIAPFEKCKRSDEGAHWAGYTSVRDGASYNDEDICNGELVLYRRPMSAAILEQELEEEIALRIDSGLAALDDEGDGRTMQAKVSNRRRIGSPDKTF